MELAFHLPNSNGLLSFLVLQVDEKQKTVLLTEQGYEDAEEILDVKDLYDPREQWASYVLNAIKAKELFLRDVNYIIRAKEVLIVDEFTGRVMQVLVVYCLLIDMKYSSEYVIVITIYHLVISVVTAEKYS